MIWPVTDLGNYLLGEWLIDRRIVDCRTGARGSLDGTIMFAAEPNGLTAREDGRLRLGDYDGPATRRDEWHLHGATADIRFADGRPFHALDLSAGRADVRHDCGPDVYLGRYRVLGPDAWRLTWLVRGPRKRLVLHTRLIRAPMCR